MLWDSVKPRDVPLTTTTHYGWLLCSSHSVTVTTFSWCVLHPAASSALQHVESRSIRSSCWFFWKSRPSLLELCNARGHGMKKIKWKYNKLHFFKCRLMKIFGGSLPQWVSMEYHSFSSCEVVASLTITSLSSMSSAVKWYWGNCTETLPPSMVTGAYRGHRGIKPMSLTAWKFYDYWSFPPALFLTHLEFGAHHCRQLTFLTNAERIGPGPVGNALSPGELISILNHFCYHFVIRLGIKQACDRRFNKV